MSDLPNVEIIQQELKRRVGEDHKNWGLWGKMIDPSTIHVSYQNGVTTVNIGAGNSSSFLNDGLGKEVVAHLSRIATESGLPTARILFNSTGVSTDEPKRGEPVRTEGQTRRDTDTYSGRLFGSRIDREDTLDGFYQHSSAGRVITASQLILDRSFLTRNRLLIVGSPGCGKTHLLEALALQTRKDKPHHNVYLTGPTEFQESYKAAAQDGHARVAIPKEILDASVDNRLAVALFDDVSQLSPTACGTLDSLADAWDYLSTRKVPVIIASNLTAEQLKRFYNERTKGTLTKAQERILARVDRTGAIRLDFPSYEESVGLVKFLLERYKTSVAEVEQVARLIATHAQKTTLSPSYTFGIVDGIMLESITRKTQITPEFVQSVLAGSREADDFCLVSEDAGQVDRIIAYVAAQKGFSPDVLRNGKRSDQSISYAKALGYYLATRVAGETSTLVGQRFRLNHATVLAGRDKLEARLTHEATLPDAERETTIFIAAACQALGYRMPSIPTTKE